MGSVLEHVLSLLESNAEITLTGYKEQLNHMEKQARSVFFIAEEVKEDITHDWRELSYLLTEVFVDLSQSIYSGAQAQYRGAYQSLRSALELTMGAIYFADHLVEFKQWQSDKIDFQFSTSKLILTQEYADAIGSDALPKHNVVTRLYRELSQYVHGKFNYLTVKADSAMQFDNQQAEQLIERFSETYKLILLLCTYRFSQHVTQACTSFPYLQTCLEEPLE